jgi:thiol-disulfide isomerase/thioredoxin
MLKKLIWALLLLAALPQARAEGIAFADVATRAEWEAALARAESQGQLLFVNMYASWCGYCKKMDREVYVQPDIAAHYNANFVSVRIDGEAGVGPELVARYGVTGYPELLFVGPAEALVHKGVGYLEADEFRRLADDAQKRWKRVPELQERLQAGTLDEAEALELAAMLAEKGDAQGAGAVASRLLAGKPLAELMPYKPWRLISEYAVDPGNPLYEVVAGNRQAFERMRGEEAVDAYFQACLKAGLAVAVEKQDEALMRRMVEQVVPQLRYNMSEQDLAQMAALTEALFYQKVGDWARYAAAVDGYIAKHPDDTDFALAQAKEALQAEGDLSKDALRWCQHVIDAKPGDKFEAEVFYAVALSQGGEKEKAIAMVQGMQERYADDAEKMSVTERLIQYINR